MQLALIDHYDSFTFNVIAWLKAADPTLDVLYLACDDTLGLSRLIASPLPLLVSPGPKRPEDAPHTLAVLRALLGKVPILGLCLGHQMLGHLAGAAVVRSQRPEHGTLRAIHITHQTPLTVGLGAAFDAAVYHSLVVAPAKLDATWRVDALDDLGEVQAMSRHVTNEASAYGLQFHPESYLTAVGPTLATNWCEILKRFAQTSATLPLSMPS